MKKTPQEQAALAQFDRLKELPLGCTFDISDGEIEGSDEAELWTMCAFIGGNRWVGKDTLIVSVPRALMTPRAVIAFYGFIAAVTDTEDSDSED